MKYLLSVVGTLAVLIIATQADVISKEQAEQLMREDQAKEQDDLASVQQFMSDEQAAGNSVSELENIAKLEAEMQGLDTDNMVEEEGAPPPPKLSELQIQDMETDNMVEEEGVSPPPKLMGTEVETQEARAKAQGCRWYRYYIYYYRLYCRWRSYYYRLLRYYKSYRRLFVKYRNLYYRCIHRHHG